jgi:hypothetical protein
LSEDSAEPAAKEHEGYVERRLTIGYTPEAEVDLFRQDPNTGGIAVLLPEDHPLVTYSHELRKALHEFPQNQRAAVYGSVLAAFKLTRAMFGNDEATAFALLLGALEDLEHGRVHGLFKPNPTKPDTHPIGTNEWSFRAVAAACLSALHQASGNLKISAEQLASWYREGGHDVSSQNLMNWRKDLQRSAEKRAEAQRKKKNPSEPKSGLEGAKPLYRFTTERLLQQLDDQGAENLIGHLRENVKHNVRM